MSGPVSTDEVVLELLKEDRFALWEIAGVVEREFGLRPTDAVDEARRALRLLGAVQQIGFALTGDSVYPEDLQQVNPGDVSALLEDPVSWIAGPNAPVAYAFHHRPDP